MLPNAARALTVLAAVLLTGAGVAAARADAAPIGSPGASGSGDPYFPWQGNGGYDVASYRLNVSYDPATRALGGTAHIEARATQALSRFDLDLRRNLTASQVRIDGRVVTATQPKDEVQELVVTPAATLRSGERFTVDVTYAGTARPAIDPDGSLDGFIPTDDGAFVASEPQGSPTWFPVNDTPRDKATYEVSITVPTGLSAISNGVLVRHVTHGATNTWAWRLDQPVSSYLVTATLGRFDIATGTTPGGVPYLNAVDPTQAAKTAPVLTQLPAIVDYFSSVYGTYPFGQAGAIVDHAPKVGYALETATRPVFDRAPDVLTLAHELAHQWYGDDVTLDRWRNIWLNEGFAEFSTWLYDEHTGGRSTAQHLADLLTLPADDGVWSPPPGNPGSGAGIFSGSIYDRGAATLAALREKLGDTTFFAIMRGWVTAHAYGNASVPQFTAYAARVSGVDLTAFFDNWLYHRGKPSA